MSTWRWGAGLGTLVSVLIIAQASCGEDRDDDDGDGAPTGNQQIEQDPLTLDIQSVTLPEGTDARPVVTFRVIGLNGAPVEDLVALITNQNASTRENPVLPRAFPRFTLAFLDERDDFTSLYERTATAGTPTAPEGVPPTDLPTPATGPVVQAASQPSTPYPLADLQPQGNGVYQLTLPAITRGDLNTPGNRNRTHQLAGWITRDTPGDTDIGHDAFQFVPSGSGQPRVYETITDQACNRCHGELTAHGTRRGTQLCITCHSPQTTDPDTSRTVDFKQMIHKIHAGQNLPSVRQGKPYFIVGNQQSLHDFSEVAFPWHDHGVAHCTVCHQGANADNWRTRPTLDTCTSCHDNVSFEEGTTLTRCALLPPTAPFQNCAHTGDPRPNALATPANRRDPVNCLACHGPGATQAIDRFHHGD